MTNNVGNTSAKKNTTVKNEKGDIQILWENYLSKYFKIYML